MMDDGMQVNAREFGELAKRLFERAGLDASRARAAARVLVDAEMMGISTHGAARLVSYSARIRHGAIDPSAEIAVERRAPSLALVDGRNGLGPAVASEALDLALTMARDTGIAYVGCRRSNHLGALAPYALQACEAGFVLVAGTNASAMMAPWGGAEARLGNNPVAVGAPVTGGPHLILDIAMSEAARSKIRAAAAAGTPIPAGWASDRDGVATTDPAAALAGLLLPIGGHKGSGLALAIDILSGVLTGGNFLNEVASGMEASDQKSNLGHFFLVIDPDRLIGRAAFDEAMARFRDIVGTTPAARGVEHVTLPGERMQAHRREALANGLRLPAELYAKLVELAGEGAR
jgi:LDH2 family malate/lactate/ureidoglycolate dehydrogenase